MSFWPNDIFREVKKTPREIMSEAANELRSHTQALSVSIPEIKFPDRVVLQFIVSNKILDTEINVFEASHRESQPYPVVIKPPKSDIPDFLRRERRVPVFSGASLDRDLGVTEEPWRIEKNEWVCATPSEFTEKIKQLLAQDEVKSNIVSLLAP